MEGNGYIKPHFAEYLINFDVVKTKAIRIIGKAGGGSHWYKKRIPYFTSITELKVHDKLPNSEKLKMQITQ
jgi:hypothetical protein